MMDFAHARRMMVDTQLRTASVTDRRLLDTLGRVPREVFVPKDRRGLAYIDAAIAIAPGRYLPAATPFARLVQLAGIEPTDRVLDVGCGTGYSTAVIAALAGSVVGLESDPALAEAARANLRALGISNAAVTTGGDGAALRDGPFDVVVLGSGVPAVPDWLLAQVRDEGGRLVALIGSGMSAVAHIFVKSGKGIAGRAEFNATLPALAPAQPVVDFVF